MFTVWERYLFREFAKNVLLFIISFFILYVLIDFSTRHAAYRNVHIKFFDIASYYLFILIQRCEILVPFALLLASIKTLYSLNVHNELVALIASGIPLKTLMRPFIIFILLMTIFLYVNTELFIPASTIGVQKLQQIRIKEKYKGQKEQNIYHIPLEKDSVLIYHRFDPIEKSFFDAIWVRSPNDLYRMKYFYPDRKLGSFVDHYTRNEQGELILLTSFPELEFQELIIGQKILEETLLSPSNLSLTELWRKLPPSSKLSQRENEVTIAFYRKISLPWLSLLTFLAITPFCLRFTRQLPAFMLYLAGMTGLVSFYLIINAAYMLGENQVISPYLILL